VSSLKSKEEPNNLKEKIRFPSSNTLLRWLSWISTCSSSSKTRRSDRTLSLLGKVPKAMDHTICLKLTLLSSLLLLQTSTLRRMATPFKRLRNLPRPLQVQISSTTQDPTWESPNRIPTFLSSNKVSLKEANRLLNSGLKLTLRHNPKMHQ
jgi:hypothetical protein